jgi:hypothetical protein
VAVEIAVVGIVVIKTAQESKKSGNINKFKKCLFVTNEDRKSAVKTNVVDN